MGLIKLVPLLADPLEGVFGSSTPQNILVAEMVGDERMLQPGPLGDGADTSRIEAFFGELRQCGV